MVHAGAPVAAHVRTSRPRSRASDPIPDAAPRDSRSIHRPVAAARRVRIPARPTIPPPADAACPAISRVQQSGPDDPCSPDRAANRVVDSSRVAPSSRVVAGSRAEHRPVAHRRAARRQAACRSRAAGSSRVDVLRPTHRITAAARRVRSTPATAVLVGAVDQPGMRPERLRPHVPAVRRPPAPRAGAGRRGPPRPAATHPRRRHPTPRRGQPHRPGSRAVWVGDRRPAAPGSAAVWSRSCPSPCSCAPDMPGTTSRT